MMEKFHHKSEMLAKCYEDILKIDPTCVTTLKKLIVMSKEGTNTFDQSIVIPPK